MVQGLAAAQQKPETKVLWSSDDGYLKYEKQKKLLKVSQKAIQVETHRISHGIRVQQMRTENKISIL